MFLCVVRGFFGSCEPCAGGFKCYACFGFNLFITGFIQNRQGRQFEFGMCEGVFCLQLCRLFALNILSQTCGFCFKAFMRFSRNFPLSLQLG